MSELATCVNANSSSACYFEIVQNQLQFESCLQNLSNYSPMVFPTAGYAYDVATGGSQAKLLLSINVWLTLYNLLSLTNDGLLSVIVELDLLWPDPNINCGKGSPEYISSSLIWTPQLRLLNPSTSNITFKVDHTVVILRPDVGSNVVHARLTTIFASTCHEINLISYPFDTQTCTMQITASNGFGLVLFELYNELNQILPGASDDEWELKGVVLIASNVTLHNLTYGAFNMTFTMQRRSYYYVLYLIVPTIILQSLMALVFIIPTDDGAKLSLSATFVLVLYVLYDSIINMTPQFQQDQTPHIVTSLFIALFIGFFAVIESVLLQTLHIVAPGLPSYLNRFVVRYFVTVWKKQKDAIAAIEDDDEVDAELKSIIKIEDRDFSSHTETSRASTPPELEQNNDAATWYLKKMLECHQYLVEVETRKLCARRLREDFLAREKRKHKELKLIAIAWKRFEYLVNFITLLVYIGLAGYFFGPYLFMYA